jgi:hypothetical protein
MGRNLARVGTALVSVVVLVIGVLGLVQFWPSWVWIALGVAGLVGIAIEFLWERHNSGGPQVTGVKQSQRGGRGSQERQAGRDISKRTQSAGDNSTQLMADRDGTININESDENRKW